MRAPPGLGLLLVGSGLYWVLASPLIGWFSVLDSGQIQLSQLGITLVLATGIVCLVLGVWMIPVDFDELSRLFLRNDGWIFTIPIGLVVADIYLTLVGLSLGNWELNPFVESAVQIGPWAVIPYVVSYIALSEGLGLWMLSLGKWLFGSVRPWRFMPFALVCGAASVGPVNNLGLLAFPSLSVGDYSIGSALVLVVLSAAIYQHFRQ